MASAGQEGARGSRGATPGLAVEVTNLRREFTRRRPRGDTVIALADVDLAVETGEIHGLLGPNGAGKTTLVKILSTVLVPTSGEARVCGLDVVRQANAVRRQIGLVFGGDRGLYTRLTARQNLEYWSALYGVPVADTARRIDDLLSRVGLAQHGSSRVETFSRGMKQRLHLARGLVGDPAVLFLDEPTVGLDPMASLKFRELVLELRAAGTTILLTTHDLAEAEAICTTVSLIDRGHILATEQPAKLSGWMSQFGWVEAHGIDDELVRAVAAIPGVATAERRPDGWVRFQASADGVTHQVLAALVDRGVTGVRTGAPSLTDVYLHLIGDRGMQV